MFKIKYLYNILLNKLASTNSNIIFVLLLILILFFILIFFIPGIILFLILFLKFTNRILINKGYNIMNNAKILKCFNFLHYYLYKYFDFNWQLHMFYSMHNQVLLNLIKKINNDVKHDVWFVPSIFWPQVTKINGTVVINAPDLVSQEFAQSFANIDTSDFFINDCRETLLKGNYFITYCEYLKNNLVIGEYAKEENKVVAIKHANNDMLPYIKIDITVYKSLNTINDWNDIFAREILKAYICPDVRYIFYASQIRPNKNMLNLVKAYEILLRKKFITHKLYVTANLKKETEVSEYIKKHRLEDDIISLYNVSAQTLAALYHCADLVVNPTLYEGGFPFTFGEGMSVGTPSIMSDIPQVREVLEPAGLEEIMFNPYDCYAIADKIEWALSNLDDLYQKELALYKKMSQRTYSLVAEEYVNAFKKFIEYDKRKNL